MPVDKFGHTDETTVVERIVSSGVTLTQINANFLRLDGATKDLNMGGKAIVGLGVNTSDDAAISRAQVISLITNPSEASKKYVDEQVNTKVRKSGDTMTGDLLLRAGGDQSRKIGCTDLSGNREFVVLLGTASNKIRCQKNNPVALHTRYGFCVLINDQPALDIDTREGTVIKVFTDISMHGARVTGLAEPTADNNAATKKYVDEQVVVAAERLAKRSYIGLIPSLEANISKGFEASASSTVGGEHQAYAAFNFPGVWVSNESETAWVQIKCLELVSIWRIGVGIVSTLQGANVNLSGSQDGVEFTTISITPAGDGYFYTIPNITPFQFYRVTITNRPGSSELITMFKMQLYEYLS